MPQVNSIVKQGMQDRATRLILEGKTTDAIAGELQVTRAAVKGFKRSIRKTPDSVRTEVLKGAVRLEISQETALGDLRKQRGEAERLFDEALTGGDSKAAYAWFRAWMDIGEKMFKVTGLYNAPLPSPLPAQESVADLSDEEVERRAKEILKKRSDSK